MDTSEVGARQSRVTSARNISRDDIQTAQRGQQEPPERRHRDPHEMATATLLRSGAPHSQPHSYSPSYPDTPAPPTMPDMISPVEPRRASDPAEGAPPRQSLPSLSEVISGSPVGGLSQSQTPGSIPSFPAPFSASPRPFMDSHSHPGFDKGSSPQPLHPGSSYSSRPEQPPAFSDPSRAHAFAGRPGPSPLNSFSPTHPSPPTKQDQPRLEPDRIADQHATNGAYHHPPTITPYSATSQLPQTPYPVSPRHPGPLVPSPFDPQRGPPPRLEDENLLGRPRYDMTVNRHLDTWTYQEWLNRIASSSRTIFTFAEGYGKLAQEQHPSRPIPERLPSEREVADMLGNIEYIRRSLESVRDLVQQHNRAEIPRETKGKAPFEEEDTTMYDGPKQATYGGTTEVKKRRGRAAPPGRCHSCNRIDTPEWRRGPDGARTLCNACGLHYAKLERKRQLEARSIRPRQADEAS